MASFSSVKPVFLKQKDIPDSANDRPTVLEICLAAERVAGQGTILGAQDIRGLWRVYPATQEARTELLIKGMRLRGSVLQMSNTNPFILRDETGEEKLTTKVWIDNIPISVADSEIEHSLVKVGCELRSGIKYERARDSDNKLTRFLTGRRFVFITVPSTPLDKLLKVSIFSANIYHKEQKLVKKIPICSRCLERNHHVSECTKEVVCRECKQSGHKRGDPDCQFSGHHADKQSVQQKQQDNNGVHSDIQSAQTATPSKAAGRGGNKAAVRGDRGRPPARQSTLFSSLDLHLRSRSQTPKRSRSKEGLSPRERMDKQRRRDDSPATSDLAHVSESVTSDVWR